MKRALVFVAILLIATPGFCGGATCKVVIDYYGAVTAEANAINSGDQSPRLKEEAALLGTSIEAMCDVVRANLAYIDGNHALAQRIINISYEACDWAKEMRTWRDELRGPNPNQARVAACAAKMRAWRDKIVKFYTEIAEEQMADEGYSIPTIGANGHYPVTP